MQKSLDNLLAEFGGIRAGRANPHVLDKIKVDYYGTPTPLTAGCEYHCTGSTYDPDPAMGEASLVKEIEKAIMTSDLGINPTNDGNVHPSGIPGADRGTQKRACERRKEERARAQRLQSVISAVMPMTHSKSFPNQRIFLKMRSKNWKMSVQKLTDKYIAQIDKAVDEKNKEILTV